MRSGAGVAGVGKRLAIRRGEFLLQRISANHLKNPITLPHLDGITCILTDSTSGIGIDVASFCRLDGKHVVFGKVLSGVDVVFKIEAEGQQSGTPRSKVVVVDSGELPL